jgi:hypothetical protein
LLQEFGLMFIFTILFPGKIVGTNQKQPEQ